MEFIFASTLSENRSLHFTLFIFKSELTEWSLCTLFHGLTSCDDSCMKHVRKLSELLLHQGKSRPKSQTCLEQFTESSEDTFFRVRGKTG